MGIQSLPLRQDVQAPLRCWVCATPNRECARRSLSWLDDLSIRYGVRQLFYGECYRVRISEQPSLAKKHL